MNTNLFKAKLVEKGYTTKSFRTKIGVSGTTMTQYYKGNYKPNYEFLKKSFEILELTSEEFFRIFFDKEVLK